MITCVVVDDELHAREELADLLSNLPDIEVLEKCANAFEALSAIHKLKPQLVFLDIQMPRISGLELAAMLDEETRPHIVFSTAFDEYSLKAYEHSAFDYLLKPIEEERLNRTLERLRKELGRCQKLPIAEEKLEIIPCYVGERLKVIPVASVEYVFSDLSGVHVATAECYSHTQLTLKTIEERTSLIRVHKQYLVAPEAIAEIELLDSGGEIITKKQTRIPVSRRYLKSLKQRFGYV